MVIVLFTTARAPPLVETLKAPSELMLFWKAQFEILDCCTDTETSTPPLCLFEMKASAEMCSPVMSLKTNLAELEVHTILLVISGREEESP